jgi:hypothetical protein
MIEHWLMSIRDHPARPPAIQRHVLCCLALRMTWETGCGFASTAQMMADSDASKATVKRATKWGRDHGHLLQTRRGQRLGSGQLVASEWRLILPAGKTVPAGPRPQGLTPEPYRSQGLNGPVSRAQRDGLKGSPQTPHQESVVLQESSSSSAGARGLDLLRAVDAEATEEESAEVLNILRGQGSRDPVAVLRSMSHADRRYYLGRARHNADRDQWRQDPRVKRDDPERVDVTAYTDGIRKRLGWARKQQEEHDA